MIRNIKEKADEAVDISANFVAAAADAQAKWLAAAQALGFKPRINLVDFAADLADFATKRRSEVAGASAEHASAKHEATGTGGEAALACHAHVVRARSNFRNRFGTAQANVCFGKGATPEDPGLLDAYARAAVSNLTSKPWKPTDPDIQADPAELAKSIEARRAAMVAETTEQAAKKGAVAATKGDRDQANVEVRNGRNGSRKMVEGAFTFVGDLEAAHRVAVHHHASPTVTEAPADGQPDGTKKPEEPKK